MIYTFFNGTPLRLVPCEQDNGYRFFVSKDGKIGLRIAPSGVETMQNATTATCENCKVKYNANRKQRYLKYKHPWNTNKVLYVSRAVYLAWSGKPIPPYHQIHHLTGIVTDNNIDNLLCVSIFKEHRIADDRQKALKTVVPNGDLRGFDYAILRELQAPRTMSDADFQSRLEYLRFMRDCDFDPRIFTAADFHYWFSMPFEEFKAFFLKYKDSPA